MENIHAIAILFTLVSAWLSARHLGRGQHGRLNAMRNGIGRSSLEDLRTSSPRSDMRSGENWSGVMNEIHTKPVPFRRSVSPPVGQSMRVDEARVREIASMNVRCRVHQP